MASPDNPEGQRFNGMREKGEGQRAGATRPGFSPPPVDLGGNESPAWQDYFFLAPNVRFTRTPDYEPRHRQHQDEAATQEAVEPPPAELTRPGAIAHHGQPPLRTAQPQRDDQRSRGATTIPAPATAPAAVVANGAPVTVATTER
ncbi:hypothetical protein JMG10_45075, partial [Nostoc ellipsosporum NOK]|nr:hypothetical protein [Nostoc ellipsosporum NOK]